MKVLVVADEWPWPTRSGYRQRLHWVLTLLSAQADVELLVVLDPPPTEPLAPPPPGLRLSGVTTTTGGELVVGRVARLLRWFAGRSPRVLVGRGWGAARAAAEVAARTRPDVTWFSHSPVYLALEQVLPPPHVVDLDNLRSAELRHRRTRDGLPESISERLRRRASGAADHVDESRWRQLERRIASSAAATAVCSELDRRRLGEGRVHVLPNGYERSEAVRDGDVTRRGDAAGDGAAAGTTAPVLLMVGLLTYEPNWDGATYFVREVLPLVLEAVPDARLRVVGRYRSEADADELRAHPAVDVLGEVPEVAPELLAATAAIAPIRFGGGTRIKILEALAHGLPLVTTTVGCEGLDVVPGEHLLVGDTPAEFAAACVEVLTDAGRRQALGDAGHDLWRRRYRWAAMQPAVDGLLDAAVQAR